MQWKSRCKNFSVVFLSIIQVRELAGVDGATLLIEIKRAIFAWLLNYLTHPSVPYSFSDNTNVKNLFLCLKPDWSDVLPLTYLPENQFAFMPAVESLRRGETA